MAVVVVVLFTTDEKEWQWGDGAFLSINSKFVEEVLPVVELLIPKKSRIREMSK